MARQAKLRPTNKRQGDPIGKGGIGFHQDTMSDTGAKGAFNIAGLVTEHPALIWIKAVFCHGLFDHQ